MPTDSFPSADVFADLRHPSDGPDLDIRIRIDEHGVRFSVSCNLAFVDENTAFVRELEDHLDEAEYGGLFDELMDYYGGVLDVRINGEPVALSVKSDPRELSDQSDRDTAGGWGQLDGHLECVEGPQSMVRHFPIYGMRALTLVNVQFSYPSAVEPTRVAIRWNEFPLDHAKPVDPPPPMDVRAQINDGMGDVPILLTAAEPEYVWHGAVTTALERFLPVIEPPAPATVPVPAASVALGLGAAIALAALLVPAVRVVRGRRIGSAVLALVFGAAAFLLRNTLIVEIATEPARELTAREAVAIFEPLHQNLYTAFDFDDVDEIYGALERCVAGDELDAIYQRVFRSLIMQDQGGATSRVQAVRHVSTELESIGELPQFHTRGFTVQTRWQVDGRVTHFGHTHERTQEYAGRFVVGEVDGLWRILGDELLEESTLDARAADR